ncbi:MAG: ABC transporter permease, partial [Bacteroidales bacterium]|nr:ABC transporter permease [Bacteroidales bacterium]
MKSYFKFLSRNLFYTLIEAAGLTISLAFVILIGCYAWTQYTITTEHPDYENIYVPGMPDYLGLTYGFKAVAEERVPEIEQIVNVYGSEEVTFKIDGETVSATGIGVDKDFFDLFPHYRILEGSTDALLSKDLVLVSRTFANTHNLKPGDQLKWLDYDLNPVNVTVGGIVEDFRNTLFAKADIVAGTESVVF